MALHWRRLILAVFGTILLIGFLALHRQNRTTRTDYLVDGKVPQHNWPRQAAVRLANTLSKPLCLVFTIGEEVVLFASPITLASSHPNCLVRTSATKEQRRRLSNNAYVSSEEISAGGQQFLEPPANLVLDPIRLVSDTFDPLGDPTQSELLIVRLSSYLPNTGLERISAIIIRAQTVEDLAVLQIFLDLTTTQEMVVVVQTCIGSEQQAGIDGAETDTDSSSHDDRKVLYNEQKIDSMARSMLHQHQFAFLASITKDSIYGPVDSHRNWFNGSQGSYWCSAGPVREDLFARPPQIPAKPPVPPATIEPLLISFSLWAGFTNHLMELASLVKVARVLNRTVVVPYIGYRDCTILLNMSQLRQELGNPNRVICLEQVSTLTVESEPKPINWTTLELQSPDRTTSSPESLAHTIETRTKNSMANNTHLMVTGIFLFYGYFWGEGRQPEYWPRAALSFSPTIYDLADRVQNVFRRKLSDLGWKSVANEGPALLGIHLRLTDYRHRSNSQLWELAALAANASAPVRLDGVVLCTDAPNDEIVGRLKAVLHDIPFLGCVEGVFPAESAKILQTEAIAVMQTLLSHVTCFIGLFESSFSWRIQARRILEGYATQCDQVVRAP